MPVSTAGKIAMLNSLGITHVSAHSADPGDTGTSEVSTARQPITFAGAAIISGTNVGIDSSNTPVVPVPATTVAFLGYWDALTGGNYLGSADVTDEVFAAPGNYTVNDADFNLP